MGADRDEHRVEAPFVPLGNEVLDPVTACDAHAQRRDPCYLAVEHVTRHPVCGDPVAHHPAGVAAGIADLDLVAEPGQVVGRRQPARTGSDHQHAPAAARRRRVGLPAPLEREVAEEPLDRVDRHRAVELGAIANALARVVTDPPVDRR